MENIGTYFLENIFQENYDMNDLGIIFYTNYHNAYANGSYRILNPTKIFNTFKIEHELNLEIQNTTGKLQEGWYKTVLKRQSKTTITLNLALIVQPFKHSIFMNHVKMEDTCKSQKNILLFWN